METLNWMPVPQTREGEPPAAILRAAGQAGCDLIVMGSRRKAGLALLLWRGVSERVAREPPARC